MAVQKYEDYGIDTIERNIEKFKELSEDYDSAALEIVKVKNVNSKQTKLLLLC